MYLFYCIVENPTKMSTTHLKNPWARKKRIQRIISSNLLQRILYPTLEPLRPWFERLIWPCDIFKMRFPKAPTKCCQVSQYAKFVLNVNYM